MTGLTSTTLDCTIDGLCGLTIDATSLVTCFSFTTVLLGLIVISLAATTTGFVSITAFIEGGGGDSFGTGKTNITLQKCSLKCLY